MRKWFCILLLAGMLLTGCAKQQKPENPVECFYRTENLSYFDSTGVIDSELREAGAHKDSVPQLLNRYLRGPADKDLAQTFPYKTSVKKWEADGDRGVLVLTDHFAQLKGIDLRLACVCLSMTIHGMTGVNVLEISAESEQLEGNAVVVIDYRKIVLEDLCRTPVDMN